MFATSKELRTVPTLSASLHDFSTQPAQRETRLEKTWISRGANFVVCCSRAKTGAHYARKGQEDEYMVFVAQGSATVQAGGREAPMPTGTLAIVPPGDSSVRMDSDGLLVLLFSNKAADLAAQAGNAGEYAHGAAGVAPLTPWPAPPDGWKLRLYKVDDHTRADSNMRIFRSTNLMLNIMVPRKAPRDTGKLSPHAHDDFEQGSLALAGAWAHHVRYPWTSNLAEWRPDQHLTAGSPSLLVIPPRAIHTSHNTGPGHAWLLDIFAPPRLDFSRKAGAVCNAGDYPLMPGP